MLIYCRHKYIINIITFQTSHCTLSEIVFSCISVDVQHIYLELLETEVVYFNEIYIYLQMLYEQPFLIKKEKSSMLATRED
jgi:hypothetical protein